MTSFNDGFHLAKEVASIDQQKKQFQRTGLDTVVEVINDMFSIKTKKFAAYSQGATKVLSDSPGLVEWLVGLAFSYRSLPDRQAPLILLFWW